MGDRQTTNILLAVIAGVLLFGSSAMMGALKWGAIIFAGFCVLYLAFVLAGYLFKETRSSLIEAKEKGWRELALTLAGIILMPFVFLFLGQVLFLWLGGAANPLNGIFDTAIGKIWTWLVGFLLLCTVGVLAFDFLGWVYKRRNYIPAFLLFTLGLILRAPLAFILLPHYGWQKARVAGDGIVSSLATLALGLIFGLMISIFTAVLVFSALQNILSYTTV